MCSAPPASPQMPPDQGKGTRPIAQLAVAWRALVAASLRATCLPCGWVTFSLPTKDETWTAFQPAGCADHSLFIGGSQRCRAGPKHGGAFFSANCCGLRLYSVVPLCGGQCCTSGRALRLFVNVLRPTRAAGLPQRNEKVRPIKVYLLLAKRLQTESTRISRCRDLPCFAGSNLLKVCVG